MKSGMSEAQNRTYHQVIGKTGKIWLYAHQVNSADNVYVEGDKGSNGFGGATLEFKLVTGETIALKGPWHGNSDALFKDTGVDIRDRCLTQGIIAKERRDGENYFAPQIYTEVYHYDELPTVGNFNRIEDLAENIAYELNDPVYYAMISSGGGMSGLKEPFWKSQASAKS